MGRICAHLDHRYSRFHSQPGTPDSTGFFGFFECEQDPEAAAALVDAAETWLAAHGCTQMLGPVSFTFLDEAGLLVDGDTAPPTMLMAYNPPYYRSLLEGGRVHADPGPVRLAAGRLHPTAPGSSRRGSVGRGPLPVPFRRPTPP